MDEEEEGPRPESVNSWPVAVAVEELALNMKDNGEAPETVCESDIGLSDLSVLEAATVSSFPEGENFLCS